MTGAFALLALLLWRPPSSLGAKVPPPDHSLDRHSVVWSAGAALDDIALVDHRGQPFDAARLQGRWSLVFAGFTSCGHVCPTTLAILSQYLTAQIGTGAPQVLFLTVDPERDDVATLRRYLASFHGRILGLTGTPSAIEHALAQLRAGARPDGAGGIDHSTALFVLSPEGYPAGVILTAAHAQAVQREYQRIVEAHGAQPLS